MDLLGNDDQPEPNNLVENFLEHPEIGGPKAKPRGRPESIDDIFLVNTRNYLVWLLENTWGDVGWNLRRLTKPADICEALEVWKPYRDPHYIIDSLLRVSERATTQKGLRAMAVRRSKLSPSISDAVETQQRCRESLAEADRVPTANLSQEQKDIVAEQRGKRVAALVSCPGHNVIASDPSHCCETVSKVAAGNRRTAGGVG